MADDYTVVYKAVADFTRLKREARAARKELEKLRAAEEGGDVRTTVQDRQATKAAKDSARANSELTDALEDRTAATEEATESTKENTKATEENVTTTKKSTEANRRHAGSIRDVLGAGSGGGGGNFLRWLRGVGDGSDRSSGRVRQLGKSIDGLQGAFAGLGAIFKLPMIMVGIGTAIGAVLPLVGALGVAVMGLTTVFASLGGAALALPGIFASLAGALGGVLIASQGVGAAFKAFGAVTKAQKAAAPVTAKTISDFEKLRRSTVDLKYAKQDLKRAEQDLTRARQDALRSLEALRTEVGRSQLNEQGAAAAVQQARERYQESLGDATMTEGDRAQALYELNRAEADYADTLTTNAKNREDLAEAEAKGIDKSDQVVDALRRVEMAQRGVVDAQIALQNVQSGADKPISAQAQAANEYADALAKLSPSARKFVEWIVAFKSTWEKAQKSIQESFFSRFVDDLDLLKGLLPTITKFFKGGAEAAGDFVDKLLKMVSSGPWKRDFQTLTSITKDVIGNLGDAFLSVADGLRNVVVVAGPFTKWMVRAVKHGAEMFNTLTKGGRATGRLAKWLDHVKWRLQKTGKILKNFGKGIFGYFSAAGDLGDWILKRSVKVFKKFADAGEEANKKGSPFRKMLEDMKPALTEVSKLFSDTFKEIKDQFVKNIPNMQPIIQQIREDLMPAFFDLFESLSKPETMGAIIDSLTRVLDALTELFNGGIGDGLSSFFDGIALVLEALDKVQDLPGGTAFVKALVLLAGIGGGMALVLGPVIRLFKIFGTIGKFTGLTKLITKLTGLGAAPAIATATATTTATTAAAGGAAATGAAATGAGAKAVGAAKIIPQFLKKISGPLALALAALEVGSNSKNAYDRGGFTETMKYQTGVMQNLNPIQGSINGAKAINDGVEEWRKTGDIWAGIALAWEKGNPLRDPNAEAEKPEKPKRRDVSGDRYAGQAEQYRREQSRPPLLGDKQTPPAAAVPAAAATGGRDLSDTKKKTKASLAELTAMVEEFTTGTAETWKQFWLTLRTTSLKAWEVMKRGADTFRVGFLAAFKGIQTGLTSILSGVVNSLIAPVNFIVNNVLGGLVKAINTVMAGLGLTVKIPVPALALKAPTTAAGAKPKGFMTGGHVPGVGHTDTVPAMLTPGEFVIKKDTVSEMERKYPGMLRVLNAGGPKALKGVRFYNDGGMVAGGDALSLVATKGADAALSALMAPIVTSAEAMLGPFGQIAAGLAHKIAAKAPQYVSQKQMSMMSPGGAFIGAAVPTPLVKGTTIGQRIGVGNGNVVDGYTYARLRAAERLLGTRLSIGQGSFENKSEYSGTTHTGAGAIDVSIRFLEMSQRLAIVNALRRAGFAAWRRTPDQGDWVEHVHALAIGAPGMDSHAVNQVRSYLSGGDGLGHVDGNPWRPGQAAAGKKPKVAKVPHGAVLPRGFNLGGLVPPMAPGLSPLSPMTSATAQNSVNKYGPQFGNINIQNPRQERASDSIYRTVQKITLGY